jgi:anthraniloyl-CoA monooxygenase
MKIVCIGGGPAGLYFATSMKLRDKNHDITIVERNPRGVTYGWGVVFWDDMLNNLYNNDLESAREIRDSSARWDDQEVHVRAQKTASIAGYGFSMSRKRLLDVLAKRAIDLGTDIQFNREVEDLHEFTDADLIVACDGVNSRLRQLYVDRFQTTVDVGRNKYIWLGTHKVFQAFTFAFEETEAGWIWFHAYRFNSDTSTCIVECSLETWKGLRFDELGPDESIALLEEIFEPYLDGHSLINQARHLGKTPWLNFRRISNENWYYDNVVLMGDAAHTTHFTIGSGTKLAIEDAIGLAEKLHEHVDLQAALRSYGNTRRTALLALQREAWKSAEWFESVARYIDQDDIKFAYSLLNRRTQAKPTPEDVAWFHQLQLALSEIVDLIPPGEEFILIDEDNWQVPAGTGRRAIPFLERDGQYWGPPADDETAIRELERLQESGANFIVIGMPAFWWLEYYEGLHRYLRTRYRCVFENERIVVYDLRSAKRLHFE